MQVWSVVVIAVVRMRSRDLVRDAVRRGRLAHRDGNVPRLGTVVYFRKNVRMNIDHSYLWKRTKFDLNRSAGKLQGLKVFA